MYHTIQFTDDLTVNLDASPRPRFAEQHIKKGIRLRAQVKPYVKEAEGDLVEVADLFFEDGTATRTVPFACFAFVD